MDAVTVITGPRTGAGHLFALTRNFEAVAARDGLFAGYDDVPAQIDRAEAEAQAEGKSLLLLKATSAMPRDVLERDVLNRHGMRAIFVVRRHVDTYVSLAKAKPLGAWRDTDLTKVKVKLDPGHFQGWMDEQDAWFGHWKIWLERRSFPVPILRYETQIVGLPHDTVLRRFASAVAQVGLTLRVPPALAHEGLVKQDREKTVAFKVKNWPDFSKGLTERGIEKRAFGYPL